MVWGRFIRQMTLMRQRHKNGDGYSIVCGPFSLRCAVTSRESKRSFLLIIYRHVS